MKAIKDCKWKVEIATFTKYDGTKEYWWVFQGEPIGIDGYLESETFPTKQGATNNFKKFAKLNGITNYTIKEN